MHISEARVLINKALDELERSGFSEVRSIDAHEVDLPKSSPQYFPRAFLMTIDFEMPNSPEQTK